MFSFLNRRRSAVTRTSRRKLLVERLDHRFVLAAIPSVTLDAPAQAFLGESVDMSVTFDNTHATDRGFGPFIDVYLPRTGADNTTAGGTVDGISYVAGSATYLGAPVIATVHTFTASGVFNHPYAVNTSGTPVQVTGTPGDQLLVFQLPYGSFTASQPAATINFQTIVSNQADLGTALNVRARSGFQYGNDALANPATDPSLLSDGANANTWTRVSSVQPILVELETTYIGPEDETATGPNFPRQLTINIDVAAGQTLNDVDITDFLPDNIRLLPGITISGTGTATNTPTTPAASPNNNLAFNFPSIAGTAAAVDATITFNYYVPFRDAANATVLNANSGDDDTSPHNVSLLGDWTPVDTRDTGGTNNVSINVAGPEAEFVPKSIAIQKSVALQNDVGAGGYSGGDTVQYTLVFQISDYFGFDDIVIDDVMSDGQRFDASFTPLMSVTEHGVNSSGNVAAANFTVTNHFSGAGLDNGTQALQLRVSDELVLRTLNPASALVLGGLVPVGGTGVGTDPNPATFNGGATTGTITFRAIVQDSFSNVFPSGDPSVDEGDILENDVNITGDVFRYDTAVASGQTESDSSAAEFAIVGGTLSKSIYAINGNTTLPVPLILAPGDTITYRIGLTLPSSDVENLRLDDYLPLPVLAATEVTAFDSDASATPDAGQWKFGPADTFRNIYVNSIPSTVPDPNPALGTNRPKLVTDAVGNSLSFDYGDFDINPSQSSIIDLLFTVTASNDPYADGLFLTNQVQRNQASTNAGAIIDDSIVQIQLAEPLLNIRKGIVARTNTDGVFTPTTTGPVTFAAPGTAGYRGSGTIHSTGLAANPIDSNLTLVDAGDIVTFAIVVENIGNSRKGAFDVRLRDALPTGFQIPGSGLNLNVSDGTGATITTTSIGTGLFDSAGGIELNDPGATTASADDTNAGALDQYDPTDGRNILIITYDLEVLPTAAPNQLLQSNATLYNYASVETGADFTTVDLTDPASTRVAPMTIAKSVTSTSEPSTIGNNVAIGEVITYTSTFTIPEGNPANVVWTDTPLAGLAIVAIDSITASSGDVTSSNGVISSLTPTIPADGSSASINFGTLTNANRNNAVDEVITIVYRAIVLNNSTNDRSDTLNNTAQVSWTGGSRSITSANVSIVEPLLGLVKTITPAAGQAADVFTVQLDVNHNAISNADAFGVTLTDVLPAGLNFNAGTLASSGLAPTTLTESGGTITAFWNSFPDNGSVSQITFTVTADTSVVAGTTITNNANINWSSLPGDQTTAITTNALSVERTGNSTNPGGAANDYAATANDTVVINAPVLTKTIVTTNATHTTGANVAIGEIVTYDVVFQVPNGTMPDASFIDTPDSGLSIVSVTSVTSNSTDLSTSVGTFGDVATNAVIAANGTSVTFAFGNLTNANTNTATVESITMRYTAVVVNQDLNDRGMVLDNQGSLAWGLAGNRRSAAVDGPDVTIVEPELNVSTSITPTTGQAEDLFTVTVSLDHTAASNADAFDIVLNNPLPAGLVFVGSLASASGTAPTLSQSGGVVTATWPSLTLSQDNSFTYQARLASTVVSGSTITNPVSVAWTSLSGDVTTAQSSAAASTERTGSNANPGGAENDHLDTASDTIDVIQPTSTKSITATNQIQTTGNNVAIGEIVTYQIQLTIPQGVTNAVQVIDTPDAGLAIVDLVSIGASTAISSSLGAMSAIASAATIPANGSSLTLAFGNLTNADTNSAVAETVTITYRAVVLNESSNDRGDVLDNAAVFNWSNGSIAMDAADLTIVEPELAVTTNIVQTSGQASDVVEVVITIDHTAASNADAMDVVLTDVLPAGLIYDSGLTSSAGVAPTTLGHSSGTITATYSTLTTSQDSEIRFFARLASNVQSGQVITNPSVVSYTSIGGNVTTAQSSNALSTERTGLTSDPGAAANDHSDSETDTITMVVPTMNKVVTTTNAIHTAGFNVAIGEIVTYEVTVVIPQGVTTAATLVDTPTPGLAIVGVDSIIASTGITSTSGTMAAIASAAVVGASGQNVTVNFGDLTNADTNSATNETIVITYRAVVLDATTNDRGDVLDNDADFAWGVGLGRTTISDNAQDLTIVEPELSIVVSNGSPATADAGDTVSWQIDLAHTAASNAGAFNVDLQNLINSALNNLGYVASSLVVTPLGGAVLGTSSDAGGDIGLEFTQFPLGATATITFDTLVQVTAPASTTLTNTANIQWTSLPGDITTAQSSNALSVERSGQPTTGGTGLAQDDHDATDNGAITTNPPTSAKIVVATDQSSTGNAQHTAGVTDLLIGEEVTYAITATIPEGSNTLVITDTLPLGIEYLSASVFSIGSSLTIGTATITASDRNSDTVNDTVELDFGSVVNTPNGIVNAADNVVVRVVGRVRNIVGNVDSTTLTNSAEIDLGGATSTAIVDVEVVEPVLEIIKSSPLSSGVPGTVENFTLTIRHTGASTADAFDLQIRDLLADPNLALIPGTVTTDRGTIVVGNAPTDTTIGIDLGQLAIGDTITITYNARTNPAAGGPGVIIDTPANLDWDSIPGPGGRTGNDSDPEPFTTTAPEIDLAVVISDNREPAIINDTLIYTIVVTNNGPSTATGTTVVTTLDPSVSSPTSSTPGTSLAGLVATSNVGTLSPGQSATIVIQVTTPSTPQTINSNSVVTANETDIFAPNDTDPEPATILATGSVAGSVWVDLDQDGIIDAGEVPLPGTRLTISGINVDGATINTSTTTDATGAYLFDLLRPGTYTVRQVQPTLFLDGLDELGTGTRSSLGNDAYSVTLGVGDDETGYDFTERGLRPEYMGKRRLLTSRVGSGLSPIAADDFFAMFAPSGGGNFDGDLDVDNDDYLLFLNRLGEAFVL